MNNNEIIESVEEVVLCFFDVEMEDVKSKCRKRPLPFIRQILLAQLIQRTHGITNETMTNRYGYKSHSMCFHSRTTIENLEKYDSDVRDQVKEINKEIDQLMV
jgi:chromosomal replication initiation ATPase DnaA